MKLGDIELKNNLILAPMAGYTDIGFRKLCCKFGAGLTFTEMISAKALIFDSKKTKELLFTADEEKVKAVQIFGNDPDIMAKACQNELLQKFDFININMGCPAPKINKNKEGSFLLTNIPLASEIVKKCCSATEKPISVKMRLGYKNENVAVDFAKAMEKAGASFLIVHGRTQAEMYSGKAHPGEIKKVKQAVSIPVIANGDVVDRTSYENMLTQTGCDGVMIGRGALGRPDIFSEILENRVCTNKFDMIKEHIETLLNYYDERFVVLNMRKHIACYLKNTRASNKLKQSLMIEDDLNVVLSKLKKFFETKK